MGSVIGSVLGAVGADKAGKRNDRTQREIAKQNSPTAQANAQAAVSNTNQYTPYGSSVWNITGQNPDGTNIYENRQTLAPEAQKQFDWGNKNADVSLGAQNNYLSQISENSKNPLSASSLGGKIDYGTGAAGAKKYAKSLSYSAGDAATMSDYQPVSASTYSPSTYSAKGYTPVSAGGFAQAYGGGASAGSASSQSAAYGNIQDDLKLSGDALKADLDTTRDAYYNTQKAYLDPQWENDSRAMETKLANQGIAMNSAAYNDAMAAFNRNREFAYNNARNTSITGAGAEQSRLFGLDLESGRFHNDAQNQGFNQSALNAGEANKASLSNAQMQTQASIASGQMATQLGIANANNQNDMMRFDAGNYNDAARYGADVYNRAGEYNTSAMNDAGRYNSGVNNEMSQFNASMAADRDRFNAGAQNDFSQFNANLNNSAANNAYNARLAAAAQNNSALNQEMEQLFAFRNQPMNEYNSLRQGMSMPQANFDNGGGSNFNAAQAMQNSAQQQMASANNKAQGTANMWGTIGGAVADTDWGKVGDKVGGWFDWGSMFKGGGSTPPQKL